MNCGDVHVYLFAFLDNELESARSIELQQHLDRCATCAREAEIERTIQKRLHAKLALDGARVPELEASLTACALEGRVAGADGADGPGRLMPTRRAWFTRRRRAVLAAVVPLTIAGTWLGWGHGAASVQPAIAELAVADFRHFEDEGMPLQIATADRQEVASWLREKTSIDMKLPNALASRWRLAGGRKCTMNGQKAAFAVYESDRGVASVVALRMPVAVLQGLQRMARADRVLWTHRQGDCTVVASRDDELVYVAVSRLPADRLVPLLPGSTR
ncbi:MAG: zf-HC2 domain-containing protein [Phycisphaerae bacterium]